MHCRSVRLGSGEYITDMNLDRKLLRLGLPDQFIEQGKRASLLDKYGLSPERLEKTIGDFSS